MQDRVGKPPAKCYLTKFECRPPTAATTALGGRAALLGAISLCPSCGLNEDFFFFFFGGLTVAGKHSQFNSTEFIICA
jgi:hypothetical protein